jgi:hypothetical protein
MKTENEIIAATLVERQKLWVELRAVPPNDKFYPHAKSLLEVIEATDKWKEPAQTEVVASEDTQVDGRAVKKGDTLKVFEWQFKALQRFLKLPEAAKKAAALLLLCLLLGLGFNASAFDAPPVAGLNGGTNNIAATSTNSYNIGVTNSVILTNANWSNISGIWTNQPTYVTNVMVTTPGVFAVGNYNAFDIQLSLSLTGSGTTAVPTSWSASDDAVNWTTGALAFSVTPAGTTQVTTRTNVTGFQAGWIRLDTIGNANASAITNLSVIVGRKQSLTGP